MIKYLGYLRPAIFTLSGLIALAILAYVFTTIPSENLRIIRLVEWYAFCAITFLYFSLLASPFYAVFPMFPGRVYYIKARQALGVSACFFGLAHASLAFFLLLGGFPGLAFLETNFLIAITLSATALLILLIMSMTSLTYFVRKLGPNWKRLHRLVYLAAIFILIHALMLGTHFANLHATIPMIVFVSIAFLFVLEAIRFDRYVKGKFPNYSQVGFATVIVFAAMIYIAATYMNPYVSSSAGLGIHSAHIQLAQQAQQQSAAGTQSQIPGLIGDRTKRFTFSFSPNSVSAANKDTSLQFSIFDAASGNPVSLFTPVYDKTMHLIVVNSELTYFDHVHPTQDTNTFGITYKFPKDGIYHLYSDFQPIGAIEQQFGFIMPVGSNPQSIQATVPADQNLTKTFGNYEVTLEPSTIPLKAQQMSLGEQQLTFTLKDAQTKAPITNLMPYLAAYGHLVMINEQTYDYLHVHPTITQPPQPNQPSGPVVSFMPIGIYGPIKPGIYRVFAQFNPGGNLFTADFTIQVE